MIKKAIRYVSHWEDWHWLIKYILIAPVWFWLCIKARSLWFFTPSNPSITFGGFIGETKREIYNQLPAGTYPKSIYISPAISFLEVSSLLRESDLSFPLVVKPDVGQMGLMFRRIESLDQLRQYHSVMSVDYIIQELIRYPIEVSVFYYRYPNEAKGRITGFLRKESMQVVGDGQCTLRELIMRYPRAQFRRKEMFAKHESKLDSIIAAGETYYLSHALNLSRGGKLINLEHEKDERLLKVFDDISHYAKNFYYGRYDIRCESIEDLKCGRNFSILEYNGCGAEPHHVYGNGNSLFRACKILVDHWIILYKISMQNYREGIVRWNYAEGLQHSRKAKLHFKQLMQLDSKFELQPAANFAVAEKFSNSPRISYAAASTKLTSQA
jgi:hypothetical protein